MKSRTIYKTYLLFIWPICCSIQSYYNFSQLGNVWLGIYFPSCLRGEIMKTFQSSNHQDQAASHTSFQLIYISDIW